MGYYVRTDFLYSVKKLSTQQMFVLTLNKTDTCMSIPDIFDFPKSVTFMKDLAVAYQDNMSMKCIPTHVPLLYSKIGVYIGILFFYFKT